MAADQNRREWAERIADQFEVDTVDAIEEGIQRGSILAGDLASQFLLAADYYIAGLQAAQRGTRVRNLRDRHVAYDKARSALRTSDSSMTARPPETPYSGIVP